MVSTVWVWVDAEVTDAFMNGVDDGLTVGADLIDALVQVQYPSQRLLGRRDVVAFRAKRHDGSANIAQVDRGAVRGLNTPSGEVVADEQLVDDELDLLRVQVDVSAPPALEAQIARGLGVDLGIEIVLLGPQGVGGILILEILHQPSAIEFSVAEIAGEGGQPAAAEQTPAVAHGVLAAHPGPVRQRRPGDDDGAEQLGADGGEHHDRPSRLAIADDTWFAVGFRMQRDDLFEEHRFGTRDVLDGLARHGVRQEADEIARMPRFERDADLAVGLEFADPGAVAGARIDDDERTPP